MEKIAVFIRRENKKGPFSSAQQTFYRLTPPLAGHSEICFSNNGMEQLVFPVVDGEIQYLEIDSIGDTSPARYLRDEGYRVL